MLLSLLIYNILCLYIVSLFSVIPHIHRGSGIHKEFDILRMMRYISRRSRISRVADFFHHFRLRFSGNQKNNKAGSQNRESGHCNAFLSVAGMSAGHINLVGREQSLLSGEDRGSMSVISRSQQHNVKFGQPFFLGTCRLTSSE